MHTEALSEGARFVSGKVKQFMKGWDIDDLDMILEACADDFVYDDPYDGRMTKAEFADYYRELEDGEGVFSDEMVQEADGEETHWIWWAWKPKGATEWRNEGCSLTKGGPDGVHSSRQAYYKGAGFRPTA